MPCKCQNCGKNYKVDLIIPDNIWEIIKPLEKPEDAGLLCGACIMNKIEELDDGYNVIYLIFPTERADKWESPS